ncbi:MAG: hypothetical protein PWP24_375 [Clostridiales bacterium]|nr:hypothetical protein [Clostridiales bacterium]
MIEGKYLYGANDNLSEAFSIRRKVFVEEEGMEEKEEFDGFDEMCVHAVISVEGKNLGTGRILYDGDEFEIGHICILREERRKLYGDFLVRMLIDKAFLSGASEVVVYTPNRFVPFYQKIGFFVECEEVNHKVKMKLNKGTLCKECQK